MRSSWRWNSDEEFKENVDPVHINPVRNVRHTWSNSWLYGLHRYFDELSMFREALEALVTIREKQGARKLENHNPLFVDLVHHGEYILLYRHRIARSESASDFIHYKQFIQHAAHQLHRGTHYLEYERLLEAAEQLDAAIQEDVRLSETLIVGRVDMPDNLEASFRISRDLYSVGLDEATLFALSRGLEGVARQVLRERNVLLVNSKAKEAPGADATLFDVVEILGALEWRITDRPFVSAASMRMFHWLREIRNEQAHVSEPSEMDSLELGQLIATAANSLWKSHDSNRRKRFKSLKIQKSW